MSRRRSQWIIGAAVTAVAALSLAACTSASSSSENSPSSKASKVDPKADVTITVGEKPPANKKAALQLFENGVAAFEKKYPNITVKGTETRYNTQTFSAMFAGGTAPTTFAVNFADIQPLIQRGQAADITDYIKGDKVLSKVNPSLKKVVQKGGHTYGIVRKPYTMALLYNRTLYKRAGLDPDKPPTTWKQVEKNAKAIKEKTGKTGFIISTPDNKGGWLLTTMAYSNGSLVEKTKGKKTTVTLDTPGMKKSLKFLHNVRWKDDAAGANFLLSGKDLNRQLAGGNIGQTINVGSLYKALVMNFKMPAKSVGIGPLPQGKDGLGTLGGGAIQWFNPKATPNQLAAAIKWTKFYWLRQYTNKSAAVEWAKITAADGDPVGVPEVPLFGSKEYQKYLGWIKPYVNVDRKNYTAYLESINKLPILPEPAVKGQELYAALDPVVQAVLTHEDADIDSLLSKAETQVQNLVDAG